MDYQRRYPLGIQTFSEIVKGGYVYVDKTDLVWHLTRQSKYVFMSRPRRFGKSLLSSTLVSYFEGKKELFEGLKIMALEQEWVSYPVLHLDMSLCKSQASVEALQHALALQVEHFENRYGRNPSELTPGQKLKGVVQRAFEQTGKQVAVVIDEYDAPLLEVLHEEIMLPDFRRVMQEFYVPLKALDPYIKFCFITGITKFSQLSIFSSLNNMLNMTMVPAFSSICGITESELTSVFAKDIASMAEEYGCSPETMHELLKRQYDGYHFSESPKTSIIHIAF